MDAVVRMMEDEDALAQMRHEQRLRTARARQQLEQQAAENRRAERRQAHEDRLLEQEQRRNERRKDVHRIPGVKISAHDDASLAFVLDVVFKRR